MKTLLLLLFFFISGLINSQIITKDEIKYNDEGFAYFTKDIQLKNGKNEMSPVNLSVSVVEEFADAINFDKLNDMVDHVLSASKYSLKNTATFNPISLRLKVLDEKGLLLWMDFTGQNDYGASKDASKLVYFDKAGEIIKK